MAEIVVAGHICLDIIPRFLSTTEFKPGGLIEVGAADLATGGCVSNVGRALHRLGVPVSLIGKLGNDPFGRIVRDILSADDPSLIAGLVTAEGGTTSYSVVINPPGRDRTFLHMPGENDTFSAADVSAESLQHAKILHFGYPPLMASMFENEGEELEALLVKAKTADVAVSLDLSLPDPASPSGRAPWRQILARVLPHVDLFFPSDAELAYMFNLEPSNIIQMLDECLALGAGMAIIKKGECGLTAATGGWERVSQIPGASPEWANQKGDHPCFKVEAVGTTGSGDATIAGFLLGFVRGFTFAQCLEAACAVGAYSVEAPDAASGIRPWPETKARIEAGWAKR